MPTSSSAGIAAVLFGLASTSGLAAQPHPSSSSPELAGTYEIRVCRGACGSPEAAVARGHLVLEAEPFPMSDVPEPARSYIERSELILLISDDAITDPNSCFVLERPRGAQSYAGISPVGFTRWKPDTAADLRVRFFHSPDAGYVARLSVGGDQIHGRGRSWGFGTGDPPMPDDTVVGRRIGPPDRARCIAAAEAEAAARAVEQTAVGPLDGRMRAFLETVNRWREGPVTAAFFPRTGDWTYVHTAHHAAGDHVGVWRFPAAETRWAIVGGPLGRVFTIDYHAQPIGLFAHQVMHRGTTWRRVGGRRFVPPGASASSGAFVEWRREGDQWVISSFGDESFPGGRIPSWCC